MCHLLSTSPPPNVALAAVKALDRLCSLASNASKAASQGAVALLTRLKLKGRNGKLYGDKFVDLSDRVLAKAAPFASYLSATAVSTALAALIISWLLYMYT